MGFAKRSNSGHAIAIVTAFILSSLTGLAISSLLKPTDESVGNCRSSQGDLKTKTGQTEVMRHSNKSICDVSDERQRQPMSGSGQKLFNLNVPAVTRVKLRNCKGIRSFIWPNQFP